MAAAAPKKVTAWHASPPLIGVPQPQQEMRTYRKSQEKIYIVKKT
jgi:hypothetical protein